MMSPEKQERQAEIKRLAFEIAKTQGLRMIIDVAEAWKPTETANDTDFCIQTTLDACDALATAMHDRYLKP